MSTLELPDIQQTAPAHAIPIDWVGIRGLRYPIHLSLRSGPQPTVGDFSLAVGLTNDQRGTHMSRFVEALSPLRDCVTSELLLSTAESLAGRLGSAAAKVELTFPFFLDREAPISGIEAPVDYEGRIIATTGSLRVHLGHGR